MQLDCKRHHIAGWRVDPTCTKCAKRHGPKGSVDSKILIPHLQTTSNGALGHRPGSGLGRTPPVATTRGRSETSSPRASAVFGDSQKRCGFCSLTSVGVVWGLWLCARCAAHANASMPAGVCVGLAYVFALCVLAQQLRAAVAP